MKVLFITLILFSTSVFADCSQYEAQVIAEVTSVETDSLTYCRAYIDEDSITSYSEHALCPLTKFDAINTGIDFPLVNGHDCEINSGDLISGYLVFDGFKITLD